MNILQIILCPLSWFYGLVMMLRNWCYDIGVFQTVRVGVPIISVGNMTAGGTGKTPFVEYLIRYFLNQNKKTVVLSRGYKRITKGMQIVSDGTSIFGTAETLGDEPYQIARKFPNVIVIVDEKRARAAKVVDEKFRPDVIILDDGFQHREIVRDLDIVMIDGTSSLLEMSLLPAGLRREPISSLQRADLIVSSRKLGKRERDIEQYSQKPQICIQFKPKQFGSFSESINLDFVSLEGKSCVAFCGIGNPNSFRSTLDEIDIKVKDFLVFPDHRGYSRNDLKHIQKMYQNCKTDYIITTEKDAVRLNSTNLPDSFPISSLLYIEIEAVVTEGEKLLDDLLKQTLERVA